MGSVGSGGGRGGSRGGWVDLGPVEAGRRRVGRGQSRRAQSQAKLPTTRRERFAEHCRLAPFGVRMPHRTSPLQRKPGKGALPRARPLRPRRLYKCFQVCFQVLSGATCGGRRDGAPASTPKRSKLSRACLHQSFPNCPAQHGVRVASNRPATTRPHPTRVLKRRSLNAPRSPRSPPAPPSAPPATRSTPPLARRPRAPSPWPSPRRPPACWRGRFCGTRASRRCASYFSA